MDSSPATPATFPRQNEVFGQKLDRNLTEKKKRKVFHTAREGSVSVPVYRFETHSGIAHMVVWREAGKRFRKAFADPAKARKHASKIAQQLATQASTVGGLSLVDERILADLRAQAESWSMTLESALREWADAREILGGRLSLCDAVRQAIALGAVGETSKTVKEAVAELLASKRAAQRSLRHVDDLERRLERFQGFYVGALSDLKADDITRWLLSMDVGGRSRNNYRQAVSSLITFAEKRRWLGKGQVPMDAVETASENVVANGL